MWEMISLEENLYTDKWVMETNLIKEVIDFINKVRIKIKRIMTEEIVLGSIDSHKYECEWL